MKKLLMDEIAIIENRDKSLKGAGEFLEFAAECVLAEEKVPTSVANILSGALFDAATEAKALDGDSKIAIRKLAKPLGLHPGNRRKKASPIIFGPLATRYLGEGKNREESIRLARKEYERATQQSIGRTLAYECLAEFESYLEQAFKLIEKK